MARVAPSILASNFLKLEEELFKIGGSGAELLHVDVMDGSFVPPISFGQEIVKKIKSVSRLPLDVHLMIDNPEKHIESFLDIGVEFLTFHIEATNHAHRIAQQIRKSGTKAGVALNPGTNIQLLEPLLSELDLVLVMSVNPGWGGQNFIHSALDKIRWLKSRNRDSESFVVEVDGGINKETAKLCHDAGIDILVAGTHVFSASDYKVQVDSLR